MKFTANLVKLISKRDRQELGLKTQDELCAAAEIKSERARRHEI
jgi:hypothetical protein